MCDGDHMTRPRFIQPSVDSSLIKRQDQVVMFSGTARGNMWERCGKDVGNMRKYAEICPGWMKIDPMRDLAGGS